MSLMLISAGISAIGSIMGGIGAKQTAELNAFNMKTESIMNEGIAIQRANARKEEYDLLTSANIAALGVTRDIGADRSVKAILEADKERLGRDISTIETQRRLGVLQAQQAAAGERRRGQQALISSLFDAAGTMAEAAYKYGQVR